MNKKQIIEEAQSIIDKRKNQNEIICENNYKLAREKSKDFKKFDILFREKTFEYAKTNSQNILNELKEIEQKRLFELNKIGFTEKDLKPNYSCKMCNDTGFVNGKKCTCLKKEIQKLASLIEVEGYALIPIKAYLKKNVFKISIGVCIGKKKYDKREAIKERDIKRLER